MFENISTAPPDPILGLGDAFKAETRSGKINLSVGVYLDDLGRTPVLESVKAAERRLVEGEATKSYLPIDGDPAFGQRVRELLLPADHPILIGRRALTSHTPGGTGALRVAADLIQAQFPGSTIWISDPTWANHAAIFQAAGLKVRTYAYYDPPSRGLDFDRLLADLKTANVGDVVLLHGCCHNPTGVDPTGEQWAEIATVLAEQGALPLVDFAYQGFGRGLAEDAQGLAILAERLPELLICSSFSKNFGLYRERVGALTVVAATAEQARAVQSQVKVCIRRNYSNPPAHGAAVVTTILGDPALRRQWEAELATMRDRISRMRRFFAEALDQRGVELSPEGNGFLAHQQGMFSFSGLTREQVEVLRKQDAIYIVGSGRINVAGMTEANIPALCDAIARTAC